MTVRAHGRRFAGSLAVGALLALATGSAASASPAGSIDHIEAQAGVEHVLFSLTGLPSTTTADLSSLKVMVNGQIVSATAAPASQKPGLVERTAVLVIDSSNSMKGPRIRAAKAAAKEYIAGTPADVRIGLISFAGTVSTVQKPTTDKALLDAAVDSISLSGRTYLYDGIRAGLKAAGTAGQRRLLVLTDGRDTTGEPVSQVVSAAKASGARVDIVGISVSPAGVLALSRIASAGGGTLVNPADTSALARLLTGEAQALAHQLLVSFPVPRSVAGTSANIEISIQADGQRYTDSAFALMGKLPAAPKHTSIPTISQSTGPSGTSSIVLIAGVVGIGIGLLILVIFALGLFRPESNFTPEQLLAGYGGLAPREVQQSSPSMRESAVGLTSRALRGGGLEQRLKRKLEAASLSLKPAEWLLLHSGLAIAAAAAGFLLGSGSLLLAVVAFALGAIVPWVYLGLKESRRIKAFSGQLADGLTMMSGGLKAGLSFAQSIESIVSEGVDPMASEFRRAMVEAQLGIDVEDALDRVAVRMKSADLRWVIMAVRIQRQVGGNLAELLLTVAATLREREYLRRQIRSLSAEGRMSAYVLCSLPPLFMLYMAATNRTMIAPLFHTAVGGVLLGVAAVMMSVGVFWMSRVVKVDV